MTTLEIMQAAKEASYAMVAADTETKNRALAAMADALEAQAEEILAANAIDCERSKEKLGAVMLDRLLLTKERIAGMAKGIREVAGLPDPAGRVLESHVHPNGMTIQKVSVPLGVIAIIYESRPNVTSDAAALAIKSGNACILRSGKEAHASADAITKALRAGVKAAGLPENAVCLIEDTGRGSANELMTGVGYIDLLIPRGGKGLIKACVENATVPCIETGTGICHVYVDKAADFEKALNIIENAKTSRPSVCNAEEVCLVHKGILADFLPKLEVRLTEGAHKVELRADEACLPYLKTAKPAGADDFDTEFLDYILAVGAVEDVNEAIAHIRLHSTHHSDAIVTEDAAAAAAFTRGVDSAAVYVNASTRFTDGGEFGLGCEMGISTQKLHARGPMGLGELNTYKYVVTGDGNVR
ncbi:MAG: glutamate-5-semialdehyde dehydrogenase [Clostridia bacterium]|nr:glutamate-5-semialdehyde dehydrogenase [Clostridia bacterium]